MRNAGALVAPERDDLEKMMNVTLENKGWTDEARAASIAVRRQKAAARSGSSGQARRGQSTGGEKAGGKKKPADVVDEAAALEAAKKQARRDVERRRKEKERDQMFADQKERGGENFIEGWYPRGGDGASEDPHYGVSTPDAPYGYVEGTDRPRKEPLYDRYGRPIVPRSYEDYHPLWNPLRGIVTKDETLDRDREWIDRQDKAEKEWGAFGRKKEYMRRNPGATEAEWEKHDKEQLEKWKKENRR